MEERIENVGEGNRGSLPEAEVPRVASGLHSEDSVIDIESVLPTESSLPSGAERARQDGGQEVAEAGVSEPVNAVITPDGVQELPPWLIGSDGKPLPINERTLRLIRGKTFTVRHILLTCGHKMDLQNEPRTNCETCWWEWLNNHSTLVQTAHEFYQQYGKERLVAMRGARFVKMWLRFMSTVAHMIEEQKKQEAANVNRTGASSVHEGQVIRRLGDGTLCEEADGKGIPVEAPDSGREVKTGEISNNPA